MLAKAKGKVRNRNADNHALTIVKDFFALKGIENKQKKETQVVLHLFFYIDNNIFF